MLIPVVHLSDVCEAYGGQPLLARQDSVAAYKEQCTEIWRALRQRGVVVLKSIPDKERTLLQEAVQCATEFFSLTETEKLSASSGVPGEGYAKLSGKEVLSRRLISLPDGGPALSEAFVALEGLLRTVLRRMCRSPDLGVHPSGLEGLLEDACLLRGQPSASVLRAHRYSPDAPPDSLAFSPHHDRGLLTVVASSQVRGLQVQEQDSGNWVDVPLGPRRVAVLAGYSLSYALGELLQPVLHRVLPESDAPGRVSVTLELCCRPSALVDPGAILWGAACRPEGPLPRALNATELMELFDHTHPKSINGRHLAAAAAGPSVPGAAAAAIVLGAPPEAPPRLPGQRQPQPPQQEPAPDVINICVRGYDGDVFYKVKPQTLLKKVFAAYARGKGADPDNYRFIFDGRRLSPEETVSQAGLVGDDEIEVMFDQCGN